MLMIEPRPACDHRRQLGLHAVEHAVQIDVHDLLPRVDRVVGGRGGGAADTGVVDGDAERSDLGCQANGLTRGARVGDIADVGDRRATALRDLLHDRINRIGIEVAHDHRRAVLGQQVSDCAPNAGPRSRHDS